MCATQITDNRLKQRFIYVTVTQHLPNSYSVARVHELLSASTVCITIV